MPPILKNLVFSGCSLFESPGTPPQRKAVEQAIANAEIKALKRHIFRFSRECHYSRAIARRDFSKVISILAWQAYKKYFCLNFRATLTRPIITGTSTRGPMTAAKASPELMPKTATATAMASSKLLLAAVNDRVAALG